MDVDVGGATARGRRSENQDRWAVAEDGRWAVVSDGVGGVPGGARAAELAVAAAGAALGADAPLAAVFDRAHEAVRAAQRREPGHERMAATLTVAIRSGVDATWWVGAAGDSPAFLFGSAPQRLLAPHTLAEGLVAAGAISRREAARHPGRHAITRGIGHRSSSRPDVREVDMGDDGEALVLASDGVEVLSGSEMQRLVGGAPTATAAAEALVRAALAAGAQDNVTAVVIRTFVASTR